MRGLLSTRFRLLLGPRQGSLAHWSCKRSASKGPRKSKSCCALPIDKGIPFIKPANYRHFTSVFKEPAASTTAKVSWHGRILKRCSAHIRSYAPCLLGPFKLRSFADQWADSHIVWLAQTPIHVLMCKCSPNVIRVCRTLRASLHGCARDAFRGGDTLHTHRCSRHWHCSARLGGLLRCEASV